MGSGDACFVRELEKTLEEQVEQLKNDGSYTVTEDFATMTAIPLDDDDDDDQNNVGERVLAFCDGLPVYRVIFVDEAALRDSSSAEDSDESFGRGSGSGSDESGSGSEEDIAENVTDRSLREHSEVTGDVASPAHRQVSVTFRRCVLFFLCYKSFCSTVRL